MQEELAFMNENFVSVFIFSRISTVIYWCLFLLTMSLLTCNGYIAKIAMCSLEKSLRNEHYFYS